MDDLMFDIVRHVVFGANWLFSIELDWGTDFAGNPLKFAWMADSNQPVVCVASFVSVAVRKIILRNWCCGTKSVIDESYGYEMQATVIIIYLIKCE